MKLRLAETPGWDSPYGKDGAIVPLPKRMRLLHPDALASLDSTSNNIADALVFTDVFRSPEASLAARSAKRGVGRPGYSAHNFGLAVDLDVGTTCRRNWPSANPMQTKVLLDRLMAGAGWTCYRDDGLPTKSEAWHYTFGADGHGAAAIEAVIQHYYGQELFLDVGRRQKALAKLGLYRGALDGDPGPLTRAALAVFSRGWQSRGGADTDRLLAVLTAEVVA